MHQQHNSAWSSGVGGRESVRAYATMNTVRALECLAFAALSAPELAASLQVSVRTARRLLQRLALEGFVTQERGYRRRYHATLRLAALGRQMLDHTPLTRAAAPRVAQLAQNSGGVAHLWIPGYDNHVVCAVHAERHTGSVTVSVLRDVACASTSAAGTVLREDRAAHRSCCYIHHTAQPTLAASVLQRGRVIGALALTADNALDATPHVLNAAAQLSADLDSAP